MYKRQDLDGTLLTDSKELSQTTVQILDMAVKKGIYVIPATGRSFRAIPEQIRNYPGIRYVITSNGGAIYSVLENKRIYQCLLNGQTVEEALDIQVQMCIRDSRRTVQGSQTSSQNRKSCSYFYYASYS